MDIENKTNEQLIEMIVAKRRKHGLSQRAAAGVLGVSHSLLAAIERGARPVSFKMRCTFEEWLEDKPISNPSKFKHVGTIEYEEMVRRLDIMEGRLT